MCAKVFNESHVFFCIFDSRMQTRKKHKHSKPYWDDELTEFFKKMHSAERTFLRCSGEKATKTLLRNNFIQSRRQFDKFLRSNERLFRRNKVKRIDKLNAKDPKQF